MKELAQSELAELAELSPAYLSQIESGQKEPSMAVLRRLAAALDVEPGVLLQGGPGATVSATVTPEDGRTPRAQRPVPVPRARPGRHLGRSRANAEALLRDPWAVGRLADAARVQATTPEAERLGDVREDLGTLIDLFAAYAAGTYRSVPWESMVLIAAALMYFVSPEDVVPDYLDEGYLDDAAVLAFVSEMVAPDLDTFTGRD